MAPTTIKVTVEQVTRLFRSEQMPGAGEVRLVEIPPWDEFTIESEDWTARGYLSRIFVEGLIEHPPLVCLSVKRWDDEEWTGMAMTPDEARSLAAHLLALAGPDPEEQVDGPEGKVEAGPDPEASDPVAVGINVHDLERPPASDLDALRAELGMDAGIKPPALGLPQALRLKKADVEWKARPLCRHFNCLDRDVCVHPDKRGDLPRYGFARRESNGWRLLSGLELSAIMEPTS